MRARRRILWALTAWIATRIPIYLIMVRHFGAWGDRYGLRSSGDLRLYDIWVRASLSHLHMPTASNWQYPPLVAPLLLIPKVLPGHDYDDSFVTTAAICDIVLLGVFLAISAKRGRWLGPWFWILGVPLLGPLVYGRFDIFAAFFAVLAIVLFDRRGADGTAGADGRPRWWAAASAGLGAALKIWPGLLVFSAQRSRRGVQAILTTVAVCVGASVLTALIFRGASGFLGAQGDRGIEIESLWAVPFLWGQWLGLLHGRIGLASGSIEAFGPGVGTVSALALASSIAAFLLMSWWWWRKRWTPAVVADAAMVATLLMVATSRVISPQYFVWLIALGACCLLNPETSQRRSCLLVLLALPLTQLIFPVDFRELSHAQQPAILLVTARDLLLGSATVIGFCDLWRASVGGSFLPRPRSASAAEQQLPAAAPPQAAAGDGTPTAVAFNA